MPVMTIANGAPTGVLGFHELRAWLNLLTFRAILVSCGGTLATIVPPDMFLGVCLKRHYLQIPYSVIKFVSINVVDLLIGQKLPPFPHLHKIAVQRRLFAIYSYFQISPMDCSLSRLPDFDDFGRAMRMKSLIVFGTKSLTKTRSFASLCRAFFIHNIIITYKPRNVKLNWHQV